MPEADKHIYRNPNGVLGGVCCGVAERFDLDVALVRLLAIALTVLTGGIFAFVYLAIWLILPTKPAHPETLDVDPTAFHSEVYEQVVAGAAPQKTAVPTPVPVPPAAASGYYRAKAQPAYAASVQDSSVRAPQANASSSNSLKTAFIAGALLCFVAFVAISSFFGIFTVDLSIWVRQAGPFLLMSVGLFIMGRAAQSDILLVLAGLMLAAFVLVGAFFSLQEGPFELGASLPFTPDAVWEWRQG